MVSDASETSEPARGAPAARPSQDTLGAVPDGNGVAFRLTAPRATAVELCLFAGDESDGGREIDRVALSRAGDGTWSTYVTGLGAGQLYGYRVHGPYQPERGHRFNPAKLVMDPRAGAICGAIRWSEALLGSNPRDSAPYQARSVVVDPAFDWQGVGPPLRTWGETVIYECHVRGLTKLHPEVPAELRGTYLGLAAPPVIEHLTGLGVTAIELMPVQHFASERHLLETGRENYWGYSPLAWFAPHAGYASGAGSRAVEEFQTMVRELHRAGLEVIADMVFNHTAEGGADGATLSLRGIDNELYYLLDANDRSRYVDYTGCGNTVDAAGPEVAGLILDCLRHWVEVLHVDGFRFDLATTLGRENGVFSGRASLLEAICDDPVLGRVKLIAEPWDLGPGGYQLGSFPPGWSGWNDRFRDTVRSYWRGDPGLRAELATRIAGSRDLLSAKRRGPLGGINYVTCHDGFTLEDLVSYEEKHNQANLEDNRDGRDQNLSRNWGMEGPTDSVEILAARDRAKRNLLATLALSTGIPMLSHGDELGRTQHGNNNAYCQDNPTAWVDWDPDRHGVDYRDYVRRLLALRRELGVFGAEAFPGLEDLVWLGSDGERLEEDDWLDSEDPLLGVYWHRPAGRSFLVYMNSGESCRSVSLPGEQPEKRWRLRLDTAAPVSARLFEGAFELAARSAIVLVAAPEPDGAPES